MDLKGNLMKCRNHLKLSDFLRVRQMSKWESQNDAPNMYVFKPCTFHLSLNKQANQTKTLLSPYPISNTGSEIKTYWQVFWPFNLVTLSFVSMFFNLMSLVHFFFWITLFSTKNKIPKTSASGTKVKVSYFKVCWGSGRDPNKDC